MHETERIEEKVILVGLDTGNQEMAERSLDELAELAKTAGARVAGRLIQARDCAHPATYIGKGKLAELKDLIWETEADGIVCDDELTALWKQNCPARSSTGRCLSWISLRRTLYQERERYR